MTSTNDRGNFNYTQGEYLVFRVERMTDDKRFIIVTKSNDVREYQVRAFEYQQEWNNENADEFIWCEVQAVNTENQQLELRQLRLESLSRFYKGLPSEYLFRFIRTNEDAKTHKHYWLLNDNFGFYHRYYCEDTPNYQYGDDVKMIVKAIKSAHKCRHDGYLELSTVEGFSLPAPVAADESVDIRTVSRFGYEDAHTEFKSSIVFTPGNHNSEEPRLDDQMKNILKTIAGFMNSEEGGTLLLGVNDAGNICGIENDLKHLNSGKSSYTYGHNRDQYELLIRNHIRLKLTDNPANFVTITFEEEEGMTYCRIKVSPATYPIFYENIKIYKRSGNQTVLLKNNEITRFICEKYNITTHLIPIPSNIIEDGQNDDDIYSDKDNVAHQQTTKAIEAEEQEALRKETDDKVLIEEPTPTPWRYIRLYEGGRWSFGNDRTIKPDELIKEVMVPKEKNNLQENYLVIVYKNGYASCVALGKVKPCREDYLYSNGWQVNEEILDAFIANQHECIAFRSIDELDRPWNKVHRTLALGTQASIGAKGNIVINPSFNAQLVHVRIVPRELEFMLQAFECSKEIRTKTLGVKSGDWSYANTEPILDRLFSE